jgi:ATP-binding cassette subfamily B protein
VFVVAASAAANTIPALLRRAIDAMENTPQDGDLWPIAAVMLITALVAGAFRFGMRELLNSISRRIETDLRRDVMSQLLLLDAAWFGRMRTGDLMARLTNDVQAVRMATGPAIMYFVNTIFGALFALFMMVRISPSLTGAALLPMIGLPFLMIRLGRAVHQRFESVQEQFSSLSVRAQENLSGVRIVRAYRQEDAEIERFAAAGEEYLQRNLRLAKLNGLMNPGFALLAGLGGAITVGLGGHQLIDGTLTVGGFVAFGIYLAMLTWPLIALGWTINLFQRGAASMGRVMELLDAKPLQVRDEGTAVLPVATGGRAITFRNVWFAYPESVQPSTVSAQAKPATAGVVVAAAAEPRWVLRDVSFTVLAGQTLAIVGATGSGKSALLDLIPRLFEPQRGEVLLDDVSISSVPLSVLREQIGYVPQDTLLFSETIGTNVAYGIDQARRLLRDGSVDAADLHTHTAEHALPRGDDVIPEVIEATQIAQLTDTVSALPEGFATPLGERGINLSGGQKQRTALARALARSPRVVLLDDALSAVDTQTEAAILRGLRGALSGRTAIIASHRVSAVRDADWILVLDDGAVAEQGKHDELMKRDGRYTQLLRRQQLLEQVEAA